MSCLAHERIGPLLLENFGITDGAHVKTVIEAIMKKKT